jgi:hypothetical protein
MYLNFRQPVLCTDITEFTVLFRGRQRSGIAVLGFPGEVQRHPRLAPHRVEWIVPQKKTCDRMELAVASEG